MSTTSSAERPGAAAAQPAKRSLAQEAAERVLRYIRDHDLATGDRLPSVRALASALGVAPPTLREALHRLDVTGAIRMRHGSGIYVSDQVNRLVFANPHETLNGTDRFVSLLETRAFIEPQLAALASAHGTLAQVHELRTLLKEAAAVLGSSSNDLFDANMSFHRGIAAMSGNPVAASVIDSLLDIYADEQRQLLQVFDHRRDLDDHMRILMCIRDGDAVGAREYMRRHLIDVRDAVVEHSQRHRR